MSAETIRHTQDGSSLSPEDQDAFNGIVDHYEDEYRALTEEASEQERYREALNPQQATHEEWESLTQITKPEVMSTEPRLPEQEYIQQRLAAMTAKFHETQALLPPYEDTIRLEARSEKASGWKRVTSFFSRRKGSEQAWYPEQRPVVTTLAMGSASLVPMRLFDSPIEPKSDYPSTLTNTQERRV